MKERDEQLQILMNTFGKGGLEFMCHASPVSKRSRDKIKKEISKQIIKKRIDNDNFLKDKSKNFFTNNLFVEFTFGLEKNRCKKNDIDNLIKHSLDCLKGVLFKDDSQVKKICATKYFINSGKEWTGIRVYKLKEIKNAKSNN